MLDIDTPTIYPYDNIGVNLDPITSGDTQQAFLNLFHLSAKWATIDNTAIDTGEYDKLNLDANGWVKSLPPPEDPANYIAVRTVMNNSVTDYRSGQYVVLYDGQGTVLYRGDAVKDNAASTAGRDVINVTPSGAGLEIRITATDPNNTGNYIRNIRVVHKDFENTYQSQIFNPDYVDKVDQFKAFRFMDWMKTVNSSEVQWADRPTANSYSYTTKGAPVEMMVNFANKFDADPWFCMPHKATNEYITNFAKYVKNNLEPDRQIYVEFSNEGWNTNQPQYYSMLARAKQEWPNKSDTIARADWFSRRTTQITRIWDNVFGNDKARVIGVMSGSGADPNIIKQELKYAWAPKKPTNQSMGIDAIAIAPYFGYYLGLDKNEAQIQSWIDQGNGLDTLFDEITNGGHITGGPAGGALEQIYANMISHKKVADQEGLELLAYEGGQHLVGVTNVRNNPSIVNLFTQANRDARMYDIYKEYLTKWFDIGGGLFLPFNDIGRYNSNGSWGLLESVTQNGSPKYNAVMDLINGV